MTRIVNVNNGTFQKDFTDGLKKYRKTIIYKRSDKHYLVRTIKIIDISIFSTHTFKCCNFNPYKVTEMVHHTLSIPLINMS